MKSTYITIALLTGGLLPLQAVLNAQLGIQLKQPLYSALVNTSLAMLLVSLVLVFMQAELPSLKTLQSIPSYLYLGGVIGAIFVVVGLLLLPKIGATNTMMAMVVGQLIVSMAMDHYGFLGMPVLELSVDRSFGAALLILGLYLIQRSA